MNANFFNALKEGNVELTRDQLKQINGGNILYAVAGIVVGCSDGTTRSCSGTDCTGKDNVGCSCDGGTVSKSCDDDPAQ